MKILSFDVSSASSGWALLETLPELKIVEYGLIQPTGNMDVDQRLYFFGNEIEKIINKQQPSEIVIEETIMGHGSPVTMRTMASFRGVAIYKAYSYQKKPVTTYVPPEWKKMLGIGGKAEKAQVQLFICKTFKLISEEKIAAYEKEITDLLIFSKSCNVDRTQKKIDLDKVNSIFTKRLEENNLEAFSVETSLGNIEIAAIEITKTGTPKKNDIRKMMKLIEKQYKKLSKANEKIADKRWAKLSTDIYSDAGINNDTSDAIGLGVAFYLCQETK